MQTDVGTRLLKSSRSSHNAVLGQQAGQSGKSSLRVPDNPSTKDVAPYARPDGRVGYTLNNAQSNYCRHGGAVEGQARLSHGRGPDKPVDDPLDSIGQKAANDLRGGGREFLVWQVAAVGKNFKNGSGDVCLEALAGRQGDDGIVLAPDDEGRQLDGGERGDDRAHEAQPAGARGAR